MFEKYSLTLRDREAVLRRADYLKKCNMSVSEDFSKSVREQRMHLAKSVLYYQQIDVDMKDFVFFKVYEELEETEPEQLLLPAL